MVSDVSLKIHIVGCSVNVNCFPEETLAVLELPIDYCTVVKLQGMIWVRFRASIFVLKLDVDEFYHPKTASSVRCNFDHNHKKCNKPHCFVSQ